MNTRFWEWSLKTINKLEYRISGGDPKFPMADYHKLAQDIVYKTQNTIYTFATADMSSPVSASIRRLTGGDFNHSGLILFDDNNHPLALHVTTKGFVIQDLLEVLRDADYLAINRLNLEPGNFEIAKQRIDFLKSISHLIKYDYAIHLENGDDKFYCSEASYFILDGLYDDIDLKPEIIYGVKVISPNRMTQVGEMIYTNHPALIGFKNDKIKISKI